MDKLIEKLEKLHSEYSACGMASNAFSVRRCIRIVQEHDECINVDTRVKIDDKYKDDEGCPDKLSLEIEKIGLKVWWCGECDGRKLDDYTEDSGSFCYTVEDGVESADFKVLEYEDTYCTGKVVQMPEILEVAGE